MYFVYRLSHPITGEICYVGITDNLYRRFKEHLECNGSSPRKDKWIKCLKENGLIPSISVIETVDIIEDALIREKYWISHLVESGCTLVNEVHLWQVDDESTTTIREIMTQYNMTRAKVDSYIKNGQLVPINVSPALRSQHRLLFKKSNVIAVLGKPIKDVA